MLYLLYAVGSDRYYYWPGTLVKLYSPLDHGVRLPAAGRPPRMQGRRPWYTRRSGPMRQKAH